MRRRDSISIISKEQPVWINLYQEHSSCFQKDTHNFCGYFKEQKVHDNRGRVLNATQKFLFTVSVQKKNLGFVEFSSDKELTKQIPQLLLDQVDVMIPFETMSSKEQMKIIRQANKNINPKQLKEIETHLKLGKITLSEALKKVKKATIIRVTIIKVILSLTNSNQKSMKSSVIHF